MPSVPDFPPFNTTERIPVAIDFTNGLPAGDSVASIVGVSLSVYLGTDPNAASLLVFSPGLSGNVVSQFINVGAVPGVTYRITMTVQTTLGATLSLYSHIFCAPIN